MPHYLVSKITTDPEMRGALLRQKWRRDGADPTMALDFLKSILPQTAFVTTLNIHLYAFSLSSKMVKTKANGKVGLRPSCQSASQALYPGLGWINLVSHFNVNMWLFLLFSQKCPGKNDFIQWLFSD